MSSERVASASLSDLSPTVLMDTSLVVLLDSSLMNISSLKVQLLRLYTWACVKGLGRRI
jgi:hypothetical protein